VGLPEVYDGNTIKGQTACHTFTDPGRHTVTLVASGPGGEDVVTKTDFIWVMSPPVIDIDILDMVEDETNIWYRLKIRHYNEEESGPISYAIWECTDGITETGLQVIRSFPKGNVEEQIIVGAVAYALGGKSNETNFVSREVLKIPPKAPDLAFSIREEYRSNTQMAYFLSPTNLGGYVDTWEWSFGDGETSSEPTPMHTYPRKDRDVCYPCKVTATNSGGSCTYPAEGAIYICSPMRPPEVDLTAQPVEGIGPLTVYFTASNIGSPGNTWIWDFGDGGESSEQNPSYDYTKPGKYTVTLTASNSGGETVINKPEMIWVKADLTPVLNLLLLD
jgi:PKD repeat protein